MSGLVITDKIRDFRLRALEVGMLSVRLRSVFSI